MVVGNDKLVGGNGDDTLNAGTRADIRNGYDILEGGDGNDTNFCFV